MQAMPKDIGKDGEEVMGYSSFKYAMPRRGRGGDFDWPFIFIIAACIGGLFLVTRCEDNTLEREKQACLGKGLLFEEVATRGAMGIHHSHIVCVSNPNDVTQKDLQDWLMHISSM